MYVILTIAIANIVKMFYCLMFSQPNVNLILHCVLFGMIETNIQEEEEHVV